MDQELADTDA